MYVRSNAEEAGEVEQRLVSERNKYDARVHLHQSSGRSNLPLCGMILPLIVTLLVVTTRLRARLKLNSC